MGIKIAEIAERAFNRLPGPPLEEGKQVYLYQIESAIIPECLQNMAEIARDGDFRYRQWLTKEYTITAAAGKYPLTAETDLLIESIPNATVTHPLSVRSDGSLRPLQYVAKPSEITYPRPGPDYFYYTIQNQTIRVRDNEGVVDQMTGNLTIEDAVFQPVVTADGVGSTLPNQLLDELIAMIVKMCEGKMTGQPSIPEPS